MNIAKPCEAAESFTFGVSGFIANVVEGETKGWLVAHIENCIEFRDLLDLLRVNWRILHSSRRHKIGHP